MTAKQPVCPKCRSAMEPGFLVDHTHGGMQDSRWVEGLPERSIWTGLKLRGRKPVPVTTFRCRKCWYLESYAPPA